MRRLWVAALLLVLAAEPCFALSHGIFHRAKTTDPGNIYGGGYLILVDDALALMGQLRMGLATDVEGGLKMAVTFLDEDVSVTLGGDGQFLFLEASKDLPINISGIGGLDVTFGDQYTSFLLGFGGLIDGRLKLGQKRNIYPQGGLLITHQRWSSRGTSHGDTDLVLSGGLVVEITQMVEFVTELRLADDTSFGLGLNFH
jgi:hypothetical protein